MLRKLLLTITLLSLLTTAGCSKAEPTPPPETAPSNAASAPVVEDPAAEKEAQVYAALVQDAHDNLADFIGNTVTVDGVVRIQDNYGPQEFMVHRLLVDCCIDDAAPLGFMTSLEQGERPAADQWVRVTGTVFSQEAKDDLTGTVFNRPALNVTAVELIDPLPSIYVFKSNLLTK